MIILVLLWAAASITEGMVYANIPLLGDKFKSELLRLALLVTLASSLLLTIKHWQLWLVPTVIGGYGLINGLRYVRHRLPLPQLRTVSLRAYVWLLVVQLLALGLSWLRLVYRIDSLLLASLAVIQLAVSLVLLRASLRTWRHTQTITAAEPVSSNELPSLSVLVPARNETDALERCLARLVASDYPKLEIIIFDDNSANRRTPEIIRNFASDGVRFIRGGEPDESRWLPKNQAYERLRSEASGELLLFCGVDALFEPDSLRRLVEVLLLKKKDMLSVLPLKADTVRASLALLQPMRYYWELCLPRRFFKRPPVLSTSWLIRATALDRAGGFQAASRSVVPEAYFARQTIVTNAYSFIRSTPQLGIYSAKAAEEQYQTSVRMRYPQLHRRLELVAITALFELVCMLGPIIGLCLVGLVAQSTVYGVIWGVSVACLLVTYYLAAVATKLNNPYIAWLIMPAAFMCDIALQHISLFKYEFSRVEWKGRDVAALVMQVVPRLPD